MGPLPICRLATFMAPFTYVGVDYCGPRNVLVGRRHEKRWIALFTCLTTRAIYLEIVDSQSGPSCVMAIDSLVCRRGCPLEMHSDNATCFQYAATEYRGPNGRPIKWRFIPPRTPSMGGAWERLVGVVKRSLEEMEISRTPSEAALRWALNRAERLVNSRPLTEIPVDDEEEESLTPNHFLFGTSSGRKNDVPRENWDPQASLADWEELLAHFWKRFVKEYLPIISARSKWHTETKPLQIGDLVFICDDDHRKGWRRGRVTHVVADKQSRQVRDVTVETADGHRYRRGASDVAPISLV